MGDRKRSTLNKCLTNLGNFIQSVVLCEFLSLLRYQLIKKKNRRLLSLLIKNGSLPLELVTYKIKKKMTKTITHRGVKNLIYSNEGLIRHGDQFEFLIRK